jgi:hypothetical protein
MGGELVGPSNGVLQRRSITIGSLTLGLIVDRRRGGVALDGVDPILCAGLDAWLWPEVAMTWPLPDFRRHRNSPSGLLQSSNFRPSSVPHRRKIIVRAL